MLQPSKLQASTDEIVVIEQGLHQMCFKRDSQELREVEGPEVQQAASGEPLHAVIVRLLGAAADELHALAQHSVRQELPEAERQSGWTAVDDQY